MLVVDAVVDDDGSWGWRRRRRRHRRSYDYAAVARALAKITRRRSGARVRSGGDDGGAVFGAKIGGRRAVLVLRSPHRRAMDVAHSGRGAVVTSDADADVVLGVVEAAHGCERGQRQL